MTTGIDGTTRFFDGIIAPVYLTLTKMVLVNALYFKGDWASKFNPEYTKKAKFQVDAKTTVNAQMMYQQGTFGFARLPELGGASVLSMPHKGQALEMIIILPNIYSTLDVLEKRLAGVDLSATLSKLITQEVAVSIPKCSFLIRTGT